MEGNGESIIPSLIETKTQPNRQESLVKQLTKLDQTRLDHQVFGNFLTELYESKNYSIFDQQLSENKNVRYQPKAALEGQITHGPLGDIFGIYEYKPIAEAVSNVKDYLGVFPKIKEVFDQSDGKDNSEIVKEVANTITKETNIPIIITPPKKEGDHEKKWIMLEDGNVCSASISEKNFGLHTKVYKCTPEIYSELKESGFSSEMDFTPVGDAIVINEALIDQPQAIQTCVHELGHIVEDKFIMPQKEEQYKGTSILNTEVISSLYGLKTCLLMANKKPDLARKMMVAPTCIYNWALAGTVAP